MVEVTQEDINAAQAIYNTIPLYAMGEVKARAGHDLVQAFARHRLAALPQWRPIEEAPRDGTMLLAWSKRDGLMLMIAHATGSETWSLEGRVKNPEPTHFMPLPARPETQP